MIQKQLSKGETQKKKTMAKKVKQNIAKKAIKG
jgi:hypothetical protein